MILFFILVWKIIVLRAIHELKWLKKWLKSLD